MVIKISCKSYTQYLKSENGKWYEAIDNGIDKPEYSERDFEYAEAMIEMAKEEPKEFKIEVL